ncbi:hypothetical protein G6W41_07550 [Campylobacter concisus]|uniref:hypothetical protein n=1 Tax=Campylobacter concisus TaxID=199 RepID=UPI00188471B2|nr:hypothetical protein [Campylobacter concisus]MBE9863959.1 hypothetical protein [Campylobacter concisus]
MKKIRQIKELFEAGKEKQAKDMLGHLLNDSTNQCFVCTRWIYRTMCGRPENGIAGAAAIFELMKKNKSAEIFGRVYELEDDLFSHIGFHKWAREGFKKLIKSATTKEEFFVVADEAEKYIKREIKPLSYYKEIADQISKSEVVKIVPLKSKCYFVKLEHKLFNYAMRISKKSWQTYVICKNAKIKFEWFLRPDAEFDTYNNCSVEENICLHKIFDNFDLWDNDIYFEKDTLIYIKIAEIFYKNKVIDKAKIMLLQALGVAYYKGVFIKNVIATLKSAAQKFSSDRKFVREMLIRAISFRYEHLERKKLRLALKELGCFDYYRL